MKSKMAFFDADETVINMKSMFDFLEYYLVKRYGELGQQGYAKLRAAFQERAARGEKREVLNADYYRLFEGAKAIDIERDAMEWFLKRWKENPNRYVSQGKALVESLKNEGYKIFLVSGSFIPLLRPFALELGVEGVVCSNPEVRNGVMSGALTGNAMIGTTKAVAVRNAMTKWKADPSDCFACGDSASDIPMLEEAGRAAVVNPDPYLRVHAQAKGWAIY